MDPAKKRNGICNILKTFCVRRLVLDGLADDFRRNLMNRLNHRPQQARLDGDNTTWTKRHGAPSLLGIPDTFLSQAEQARRSVAVTWAKPSCETCRGNVRC